ncbi:MAG: GntR family transcriptional regulator [Hyphomicrobiales bacterium]|nr:GntR family transcriptional regulator [Hyphomicrobiales bacterium]
MSKRAAGSKSEARDAAGGSSSPSQPTIFAVRPTPTSLSTFAYERISSLIHKRELQSGEVVVEQNLAAYLGISRTPVRQALQRLELEGLLVKTIRFWPSCNARAAVSGGAPFPNVVPRA